MKEEVLRSDELITINNENIALRLFMIIVSCTEKKADDVIDIANQLKLLGQEYQ